MELAKHHSKRLNWFADNVGNHERWPNPFDGEKLPILTRAKGIYKPAGIDYALSIRLSASAYANTGPDYFPDGSWRVIYHQEVRSREKNPATYATNAGLLKCSRDQVPIGVVKQHRDQSQNSYVVIGLGFVTDYDGGFFVIEGPAARVGGSHPVTSLNELRPEDVLNDDRERLVAEVLRRRGQGKFRRLLLDAYDARCAVTACKLTSLLEAAHILPHRGTSSNQVQNGILLRADVHTLFDLGLLMIDPNGFLVGLDERLLSDPYYRQFNGVRIHLPRNRSDYPSPQLLRAKQSMHSD